MFEEKVKILKRMFFNGLNYSTYAHDLLFDSIANENTTEGLKQLITTTTYLAEAHSIYTQLDIYLKENVDVLGDRDELNNNIESFYSYNNEVLTNIRTSHSHQWSDIQFKEYAESFRAVADLLNFPEANELIDEALSD